MCADYFAGSKETWFALPHLCNSVWTLLGISQDGVDAGIVFELFEPVHIVRVDNFLKTGRASS